MITKFIAIIILWCKSNHYFVYRAECWLSLNKISEKGSTSQSYNRVVEWAPNNGYHQQFHPQRESQLLPDSPWGSPRSASVCDLVVQLPSCVWLFVTPWTIAHQDFHDLPYLSEFAQTHVIVWVSDAITHLILYYPFLLLVLFRLLPLCWNCEFVRFCAHPLTESVYFL